MRKLKIAYVSVDDPMDRRTWSGTNFHLAKALQEAGHQLVPIGPLRPQPLLFLLRVFNQLLLRTAGKRFHYRDSFILSRAYARMLRKRIEGKGYDLIVAPAGLSVIALLRTEVPIVHFADRCTAGALGYHTTLTDLASWSRDEALKLEQAALLNATLTVYTSSWAADAARKTQPTAASRIHVIPIGANLESSPPAPVHREVPGEPLTLLLLAVQWESKGGPIAYEALCALKAVGIQARLVVCGATPPTEFDDPDLVREGFLNKNDPEQRARLNGWLQTADLLILPTRFDATPVVLCEAAANGIPVLATRTGGIPTLVVEGQTGFLFDPDEGGEAYATCIRDLLRSPERWRGMREAARSRYEQVLNWEAFVRTLEDHIERSVPSSNPR